MKLDHINLTTTDPAATAEFLVRYFGLRHGGGNKGFMLVRDDGDMVITLMKAARVEYPETFHIGFYPATQTEVEALRDRLVADGHPVTAPERGHGYSIYVQAPGSFTIEVTAGESGASG